MAPLMQIRAVEANEVFKLTGCLAALAEHHNMVSLHFKGAYPSRPYEQTLELFFAALLEGQSQTAVLEEQNGIVGFCKLDVAAAGKIDHLLVLPEMMQYGFRMNAQIPLLDLRDRIPRWPFLLPHE